MENTSVISKEKLNAKLKTLALNYLSKYSSSSNNLRSYLIRKIKRNEKYIFSEDNTKPEDILLFIDETILYLQNIGYLDDDTYAKNQYKKLVTLGKSGFHINLKMQEKGLSKEIIKKTFLSNEKTDIELFAALNFIKRKSLCAYKTNKQGKDMDNTSRLKDYAKLQRNGFSYDTIDKVIKMSLAEAEDILHDFIETINL